MIHAIKFYSISLLILSITTGIHGFAEEGAFKMRELSAGTLQRENEEIIKIQPFSLASHELTGEEWSKIRLWAQKSGYEFGPGKAESEKHPISAITWYDAVKFCNAASEWAGLTPVYFRDSSKREPYRRGDIDLSDDCVELKNNGYRLPTEWEWEYACRAGTKTQFFFGDQNIPLPENPFAWQTNHAASGNQVSPHPVGLKKPNPWGFYDMSGNVAEWCWNLYGNKASWRVQRGGSVALDNDVSSGFRSSVPPSYLIYDAGLRLASSNQKCPSLIEIVRSKKIPAPDSIDRLIAPYEFKNEKAVAARLVTLLDPKAPEIQTVLSLQKSGKSADALYAYADLFLKRLKSQKQKKGHLPKVPVGTEKIQEWIQSVANLTTTAKVDFDNLDDEGRAGVNDFGVPVTWNYGNGFISSAEVWLEVIRQLQINIMARPSEKVDFQPKFIANLAIYIVSIEISKILKDPRVFVGNQQIHGAKNLIAYSYLFPEFREAPAWYEVGVERITKGALAHFILRDGGDLEQSFNYNAGLFSTVESILEIIPPSPLPEWVEKLKGLSIDRSRLFAALRLSSGTGPSVGNTAYGRDLPDANAKKELNSSKWLEDELVKRIEDHLVKNPPEKRPTPAFTSIAFPYSGYYLMRSGWSNKDSSLFFKSARPGAGHNHADNNAIELCAYGRHLLVDREIPPYQPSHLPEAEQKDYLWIQEYKGEISPWNANTLLINGCGQNPGFYNQGYSTTIPNQAWYTSSLLDFVQGTGTRIYERPETVDPEKIRKKTIEYHEQAQESELQLKAAQKLASIPEEKFSATHTRQVIYLKPANAWVITDWAKREDGEKIKEITQIWNFPSPRLNEKSRGYGTKYQGMSPLNPGFEKEQIQIDPVNQTIFTHHPKNVNLAILQAVASKADYTLFFGNKYPFRGWANLLPSPVSGYVPAADIHATFRSDSPLVSILVPIPEGQRYEDQVLSFKKSVYQTKIAITMEFKGGTHIRYEVAQSPEDHKVGNEIVRAEALLLLSTSEKTAGLQLFRNEVSAVFEVIEGKIKNKQPLTIPQNFSWKSTSEGFAPSYE